MFYIRDIFSVKNEEAAMEKREVNASIRLDRELYEEVKKVARKKGLSFSAFVRMVLIEVVEREKEKKKSL